MTPSDQAVGSVTVPTANDLFALEPEAIRCPYRLFADLRAERPVTWIPQIEAYAVSRYDHILEVLRQPELFSSAVATGPVQLRQTLEAVQHLLTTTDDFADILERAQPGLTPALLTSDPPLHRRQRGLVNRGFAPRRIAAAEDGIRTIAHDLVDAFVDQGRAEFVSQFAVPLPLTVIALELGVPTTKMAEFKRWSDDLTVTIGNHNLTPDQLGTAMASMAEFYEYFAGIIEQRRRQPADDLVSAIANATVDGDEPLADNELLAILAQLLAAGNETTTKLLASAIKIAAADPEVLARLHADRTAIDPFIEEVLRLEPPVQGLYRVATDDAVVGGVPIPRGSALWLIYASGNRDDSQFTEPDTLDTQRPNPRGHLAFGFGEHHCVGAALARLEARVGLEVLFERLSDLALAPSNDFVYEPSYVLHGLRRLEITFRPGSQEDR